MQLANLPQRPDTVNTSSNTTDKCSATDKDDTVDCEDTAK